MKLSEKRIAEITLVFRYILGGLFPVLTVIAYTNSLSPLTTLAWSYVIATILFAILLTIQGGWKKNIKNTKAFKDIALAVIIIGICFQFLFFLSLKFTSAQNVTLISLMEIVFSFIILGWITGKEPVSKKHIFGSALMLLSAGIILFGNRTELSIGGIFMLIAAFIAPIGNIFAKRALHQVSLVYLMFMRSVAGLIIFFTAAYFIEGPISNEIFVQSIPYLLFSGLIFLGLMKVINLFGFKKTSITHTISFSSLKPVFTFLFAWILLKEAPTTIQLIAMAFSFIGLYFLATAKQKQTQYGFEKSK